MEFGGLVSIVSESWRMVGKESEEWWGINLGSDRILAIRWGSQVDSGLDQKWERK